MTEAEINKSFDLAADAVRKMNAYASAKIRFWFSRSKTAEKAAEVERLRIESEAAEKAFLDYDAEVNGKEDA